MSDKKLGLMISALDSSASREIYEGISKRAYELGYMTCACLIWPSKDISDSFYEREYHMFDIINYEEFDGLIVAFDTINSADIREKLLSFIEKTDKPVVAIDCDVEGAFRINTCNYRAQREIVTHLIEVHHCRKINYISGPAENGEANIRKKAYIDVMEQYGLFDEKRIFQGSFFVQDGAAALAYFESDPVTADCDAIVCANDMGAISVYEELMKKGKRIPDDVLVTGFDDLENAVFYSPSLTSFSKNGKEVGKTAVSILDDYWNGREIPKCTTVEGELFFRESCGCKPDFRQSIQRYNADLQFFSEKQIFHIAARACIQACIGADSFEEYIACICQFISKVQPEEFFFCVFENYMEDFQIRSGLIYQTKLRQNEGKVIVPIAYCEGQFEDIIFRDRGRRLQTDLARKPWEQYLCSPLHFRDTDFGFLVFSGSPFPLMGSIYWEWRMGISNALNSLRDRIKLNDLYMRDSLTGLYNRFGLQHYWDILNRECQQFGYPLLLMFVDVDGLKKINDQYGHEAGDYTISAVAEAMHALKDRNIIATRYGGDEFILLSKNMDEEQGVVLQKRLAHYLQDKNMVDDREFEVSACTGFVVKRPDDAAELEDCIRQADQMMYRSKKLRYHSF